MTPLHYAAERLNVHPRKERTGLANACLKEHVLSLMKHRNNIERVGKAVIELLRSICRSSLPLRVL